ncbi:MAG: glucose-6-phosphate isomerase [Gammaproteobacteria bacterium]
MATIFQPTDADVWKRLSDHYRDIQDVRLQDLFADDPDRFETMHCEGAGLILDYSRSHVTADTLDLLVQAAEELQLPERVAQLMSGAEVNTTEHRPALHTALRDFSGGAPYKDEIWEILVRMDAFVHKVHSGVWRGATGKPITDVVNIGIGGSDLGPRMVTDALYDHWSGKLRCHFVANIDRAELERTLADLSPESTLFIVASKSFTTLETLRNAETAKVWMSGVVRDETDLARHFVAVTANMDRAAAFGIDKEHIFPMWDWVGGRYSLWSAIGLPIALAVGMEQFNELRRGAYDMDEHFRTAPLKNNLPLLLGLIGIWYTNYRQASTHAVLPYAERLRLFPDFLQQLTMESNGKSVRLDNTAVDYVTSPVVWGSVESNGQHSFHQLLHQGTHEVPVDFIATLQGGMEDEHHPWLLANCLAQARALMTGKSYETAKQELLDDGLPEEETEALAMHRQMPGNRPCNIILLEKLTPQSLGALIALYEHRTFVQSVFWQINAFDQWGVELGKAMSKQIYGQLIGENTDKTMDASTRGLIELYIKHRNQG